MPTNASTVVINGLRNASKRLNLVLRSDEAEVELWANGLPPSMLGRSSKSHPRPSTLAEILAA